MSSNEGEKGTGRAGRAEFREILCTGRGTNSGKIVGSSWEIVVWMEGEFPHVDYEYVVCMNMLLLYFCINCCFAE